LFVLVTALLTASCGDGTGPVDEPDNEPSPPGGVGSPSLTCSIPESQIHRGAGKDGIPALTNPETGRNGAAGTEYLEDEDRVVGLVVGEEALAIPLSILRWHEIVNLDIGERALVVTHCPLTGSSMAFDRGPADDAGFGVSGLLYRNNLIMYDRNSPESLWPQMLAGARCGSRDGTTLPMYPIIELRWDAWRGFHPATQVVTSETGFTRDYTVHPYGDYDEPDNDLLLFPLPGDIDGRRPPKERVLGIPAPDGGGHAFPFGALDGDNDSSLAAVHETVDGREVVVFWDARREAAMAFIPELDDGTYLAFSGTSGIVDGRTGSTWTVNGEAVEGPLAGHRLEPVAEAYVAFWFAWAAFHPDTELWEVR
jgi:hypothetical protein